MKTRRTFLGMIGAAFAAVFAPRRIYADVEVTRVPTAEVAEAFSTPPDKFFVAPRTFILRLIGATWTDGSALGHGVYRAKIVRICIPLSGNSLEQQYESQDVLAWNVPEAFSGERLDVNGTYQLSQRYAIDASGREIYVFSGNRSQVC